MIVKKIKFLLKSGAIALFGHHVLAEFQLRTGRLSKNDYYDILTELIAKQVLRPDSVCVDVGCHAGTILRMMINLAPNGRFLAFEPLPDFYAQLNRDFPRSQVKLYNYALSNSEGVVTFKWVKTNPAYSGLRERSSYERPNEVIEEISVPTRKLDSIVEQEGLNRLDFIKIDVEGAERLVFEGAVECLQRFKPTIVFECGLGAADSYGTKPEQLFDFLSSRCGLKVSLLGDFLKKKRSLTASEFADHFNMGRHYYWVAHG